jgi:exoribonuclease R
VSEKSYGPQDHTRGGAAHPAGLRHAIEKTRAERVAMQAEIDQLEAWKTEYLKQQQEQDDRDLVDLIAKDFTAAGLPKSAAFVYLSNTPAGEVGPDNVAKYIAELRGTSNGN